MAWSEEARRKASQSRKNNSKAKATQGGVKQSEYGKTVNSSVRAMKKSGFSIFQILLLAILFISFFAGGFALCKVLTRNDYFDLLGDKGIVINVGMDYTYSEDGFKAISFSKDVSDQVVVSTNLMRDTEGNYIIPTDKTGEYVIKYTINSSRLKNIVRYRVFRVE